MKKALDRRHAAIDKLVAVTNQDAINIQAPARIADFMNSGSLESKRPAYSARR